MGEVNILVGLSGVGKNTVLEEALMLADKDYEEINYGDRMIEIARKKDLVESRDDMKNLDSKTYKEIQKDAAESIFKDAEDKDIIVNTHAAIKSPFGYIPGLPKWSIEELQPGKIIMLTADAEEIWNRTQGDNRDREHEGPEDIAEYQTVAREMAAAGSVLTGAYLKVIENHDGKAEQAAEELVKTLRN